MADRKLNVVVCGGGNGAHTFAGISSFSSFSNITVLDIYEDEADRWKEAISNVGFTVKYPDGRKLFQKPSEVKFRVTKMADCVTEADVVILCVPAYAHQVYLDIVVPVLKPGCVLVGMPGQAGFEYQAVHQLREHSKQNSVVSFETLPWACRIDQYGSEVSVVGVKKEVLCCVICRDRENSNSSQSSILALLQPLLGSEPVLVKCDSVLENTLAGKSTIHPPIMYAKWSNWDGRPFPSRLLFYQGVDETAAAFVGEVNDEMVAISKALADLYPGLGLGKLCSMQDWLIEHYGDQVTDKSTLLTCLQTNQGYAGLNHPCKKTSDGNFAPDFSYRYTTEDIPYGLVVFREIAELARVPTPMMDRIITWAQGKLGIEFLKDGKVQTVGKFQGRPLRSFGIETVDELVNYFHENKS